jgi:hypothetical protein
MQQRFIRGNRTQPSAKFGRSELLQSSAHRGQHREAAGPAAESVKLVIAGRRSFHRRAE